MILGGFINHGSDESLVSTLNTDINKAIDKTKLVQKDVQYRKKDGSIGTRKQWVKATDDPNAVKTPKAQDDTSGKKPKKQDDTPKNKKPADIDSKFWSSKSDNPKKSLVDLLVAGHDKKSIMETAKANGVTWSESDHEGINWMRASMAIQKHIGGQQKPDDKTQPKSDKPDKQTDKTPKKPVDKKQEQSKDKVRELAKTMGEDELLNAAKAAGIQWKENDHKGINSMRAKMAIAEAIKSDASIVDKLTNANTQQQLKATQKQVAELTDLVGKLAKPTAQQQAAAAQQASILKGIDTGTKSAYEKKHFGSIIDNASPEALRNYRTLGMCGADAESEAYLADLYGKYTAAMTGSPQPKKNIPVDPLREKLDGVVNASVASVVKSSTKGMRKKCHNAQNRYAIISHWCDPTFTQTEQDEVKQIANERTTRLGQKASSMELEGVRKEYKRKAEGGEYTTMKAVLDKLDQHPDYKGTAAEFKKLVETMEEATGGSVLLQECTSFTSLSSVAHNKYPGDDTWISREQCQQEVDRMNKNIENIKIRNKELNERLEQLQNGTHPWCSTNTPADIDRYIKSSQRDIKNNESRKADYERQVTDAQAILDSPDYADRVHRAHDAFEAMNDPKYEDIMVNLVHANRISTELTRQYFCQKSFIDEYPVLSKANIDLLDAGDSDAITNLALHAGMFKPSLTKGGKSAKDAITEKYAERQALLDAYGGVKAVNASAGAYSEDNEIKCKVSKVDDATYSKIASNIKKDWDNKSHGNMRYKIKGIYQVSDLEMEQDFNKIKKQNAKNGRTSGGKKCSSDLFYHGTGAMATSLILGHSGQFKLVKAKVGRMLGDGIYLADKSSKSGQYISDSGYSRHGIEGSLMVVEASLGNTVERRGSVSGCDSVFAGKNQGLLNNEWCVHDPKAVVPRYLVHMEIV